jgi:hypothetical protein
VTQLVLHLHECAAEPLQDDAETAAAGAALTETSCLCVRV